MTGFTDGEERMRVTRALANDPSAKYACRRCGATYVASVRLTKCGDCRGDLADALGRSPTAPEVDSSRTGGEGHSDDPYIAPEASLGVFASLFDFGFTSLVTPRLVKAFYALSVLFLTILLVAGVIVAINIELPAAIIGVGLWYMFSMFALRLGAEYVLHDYLTGEHISAIRKELNAFRIERRSP